MIRVETHLLLKLIKLTFMKRGVIPLQRSITWYTSSEEVNQATEAIQDCLIEIIYISYRKLGAKCDLWSIVTHTPLDEVIQVSLIRSVILGRMLIHIIPPIKLLMTVVLWKVDLFILCMAEAMLSKFTSLGTNFVFSLLLFVQ